jgi:hypothetical protein
MNPYVVRFTLANITLTVVLAIVAEMIKLKSGSGFAVAAAIASSYFAASAFAKDHSREPTPAEKGVFAWRSLLAMWLISLGIAAIFLAIFSSAAEVRGVISFLKSGSILAVVGGTLLFLSAIYYVVIR